MTLHLGNYHFGMVINFTIKFFQVIGVVQVFLKREFLLEGDLISAERAQAIGLVNHIVAAENLERDVWDFTTRLIATNSASSMALTKKLIADTAGKSIADALAYASSLNAQARSTEDCKRGIEAFLNKEKIIW